jgi:aspartyl-tRNA(Asn)/glutamyl-tRNA(Gln) amidotransferase subunit A
MNGEDRPGSIRALLNAYAGGTHQVAETVQFLVDSISQRDGEVGAYVDLNAGEAIEAAQRADQRYREGTARALEGVPVGIKDILNVTGQPCRCGSRILEGYTAPYTATAVHQLQEAGAIVLGRLNMDEFAMGSSCENSAVQLTRNPWDLERVPGGSSGGSAAAVAAGTALATLGTDTGGSIRQPSAYCGTVGLKPTYGRVSRFGCTAYASSLDQIGPITRNVEDAAILLTGISGHDSRDTTSMDHPVPDYTANLGQGIQGLRIGIPREYFMDGIDPEVEQAVRAAIETCRELGAEIQEISLPHTEYAIATYYIIATAEASSNLARFDGVRYGARVHGESPLEMYRNTRAAGFGMEVKRRIMLGTYVLSSGYYDAYYLRAQKVRTLIRKDFESAFQNCDVLLTPTTTTTAFKIGEKMDDPLKMYLNDIFTVPVNLAGICAVSQPCGRDRQGLPIGLQWIGPALGEEAILRAAAAFESACASSGSLPPLGGQVV